MGRNTTRIQNLTRINTLDPADIIPIGPQTGERAKGIEFQVFDTLITPELGDISNLYIPFKNDQEQWVNSSLSEFEDHIKTDKSIRFDDANQLQNDGDQLAVYSVTDDIIRDIAFRNIPHIFPNDSFELMVNQTGTEFIVPGGTPAITVTLPSITQVPPSPRNVFFGWYVDFRNEGINEIQFVQNPINPGFFSGDLPLTPGGVFTRIIFNGIDTYRIQISDDSGNTLRGIVVPVPTGNHTHLTYNSVSNAYEWQESTMNPYNNVGVIASGGPYDASERDSIEIILAGNDGIINLPDSAVSTASIRVNIIFSIGSNNLTINSTGDDTLQFVNESGVNFFDTSFVTSINRPIILEPLPDDRWRIFL